MKPDRIIVIVDLRNRTVEKRRDIARGFEECCTDLQSKHPHLNGFEVGFLCITEDQHKRLQLERYELYKDEAEAKAFRLTKFRNHDVVVYPDEKGMPCPGCRGLH